MGTKLLVDKSHASSKWITPEHASRLNMLAISHQLQSKQPTEVLYI